MSETTEKEKDELEMVYEDLGKFIGENTPEEVECSAISTFLRVFHPNDGQVYFQVQHADCGGMSTMQARSDQWYGTIYGDIPLGDPDLYAKCLATIKRGFIKQVEKAIDDLDIQHTGLQAKQIELSNCQTQVLKTLTLIHKL